jgi:Periplasmic copper-binding protein (NosD)
MYFKKYSWKLLPILTIVAVITPILYFVSVIFKSQIGDLQIFFQYIFFSLYDKSAYIKSFFDQPTLKPYVKILIGQFGEDFGPSPYFQTGPRLGVLYGNTTHYSVTLTFYVKKDNNDHLKTILTKLVKNHIPKAVLFIESGFVRNHPLLVNIISQRGYKIYPWNNITEYARTYPPTVFEGMGLSDREIVPRAYEGMDITAFYDIALHQKNSSIIAFTPQMPPKFLNFDSLLEHILQNNDHTLIFSDDNKTIQRSVFDPTYPDKGSMSISHLSSYVLRTDFDTHLNSATDLTIDDGIWTINDLHEEYPSVIEYLPSTKSFLVHKNIVISKNARLNITNTKVFLQSSKENDLLPRWINIREGGKATIYNSSITSWDPILNKSDPNPYHPRPYITAQNGGKMDVINSTINYLGFTLGGIGDTRYARAAINYFDTSGFTVANSTIAYNYYGFYSANASKYKITGNNIYGSIKYGLDPHSGSENFIVESNYLHDNGKQGFICSKYCKNITITNNLVEHNMEGIGLHWLSNSSTIKNNLVRNNEKNGIYIDKQGYYNIIENNTSLRNLYGIGILDRSKNNTIVNNVLLDNIAGPLYIESDSDSNSVKQNIVARMQNMTNTVDTTNG